MMIWVWLWLFGGLCSVAAVILGKWDDDDLWGYTRSEEWGFVIAFVVVLALGPVYLLGWGVDSVLCLRQQSRRRDHIQGMVGHVYFPRINPQ